MAYRTTSMDDILNYHKARQAATGRKTQPWELYAPFKAELDTRSDQSYKNRALELEQENLKEKKRMDDETIRKNKEDITQADKDRESAEEAGETGTIVQGATTLALVGAMSDKDKPGLISKGTDLVKSGYDKVKSGYENLTGNPSEPAPVTPAPGTSTTPISPPETTPGAPPPLEYAAPESGYQLQQPTNYEATPPGPVSRPNNIVGPEAMDVYGEGGMTTPTGEVMGSAEEGFAASGTEAGMGVTGVLSNVGTGMLYRAAAKGAMDWQADKFKDSALGDINKTASKTTDDKYLIGGVGQPWLKKTLPEDQYENIQPLLYGSNPVTGVAELLQGEDLGDVAKNYAFPGHKQAESFAKKVFGW